jgi:hypothetical protein
MGGLPQSKGAIYARFSGSRVYDLSAWDLQSEPADQTEMITTPEPKPRVTVDTLKVAQFSIADITDANSIAQELQRIVPALPSISVQPVIADTQYEYGMFKDFLDYQCVLMSYRYKTIDGLLNSLEPKVIGPTTAKATEIAERLSAIERELMK